MTCPCCGNPCAALPTGEGREWQCRNCTWREGDRIVPLCSCGGNRTVSDYCRRGCPCVHHAECNKCGVESDVYCSDGHVTFHDDLMEAVETQRQGP